MSNSFEQSNTPVEDTDGEQSGIAEQSSTEVLKTRAEENMERIASYQEACTTLLEAKKSDYATITKDEVINLIIQTLDFHEDFSEGKSQVKLAQKLVMWFEDRFEDEPEYYSNSADHFLYDTFSPLAFSALRRQWGSHPDMHFL